MLEFCGTHNIAAGVGHVLRVVASHHFAPGDSDACPPSAKSATDYPWTIASSGRGRIQIVTRPLPVRVIPVIETNRVG